MTLGEGVTLSDFSRHAERFGVEQVYETAHGGGLGAEDLGKLASRLRSIDRKRHQAEVQSNVRRRIEPPWRLSREHRDDLIERLIQAGAEDARVRSLAGVSQPVVREHRRALEGAC